jgi:hypothetical protein
LDEKSQLKKVLNFVDATRKRRQEVALHILEHPELLPTLLEIGLEDDAVLGSRACWILEYVFKANPDLLYPFLDRLVYGLSSVRQESSIRPLAKICELLLIGYYKPTGTRPRPPLSDQHKEALTAACFDWLISAQKVAPKAYSMRSLLLLGHEITWVHPELRAVLEQHYHKGSPAYRARARHILKELA